MAAPLPLNFFGTPETSSKNETFGIFDAANTHHAVPLQQEQHQQQSQQQHIQALNSQAHNAPLPPQRSFQAFPGFSNGSSQETHSLFDSFGQTSLGNSQPFAPAQPQQQHPHQQQPQQPQQQYVESTIPFHATPSHPQSFGFQSRQDVLGNQLLMQQQNLANNLFPDGSNGFINGAQDAESVSTRRVAAPEPASQNHADNQSFFPDHLGTSTTQKPFKGSMDAQMPSVTFNDSNDFNQFETQPFPRRRSPSLTHQVSSHPAVFEDIQSQEMPVIPNLPDPPILGEDPINNNAKTCSQCSASNLSGANFCCMCGTKLVAPLPKPTNPVPIDLPVASSSSIITSMQQLNINPPSVQLAPSTRKQEIEQHSFPTQIIAKSRPSERRVYAAVCFAFGGRLVVTFPHKSLRFNPNNPSQVSYSPNLLYMVPLSQVPGVNERLVTPLMSINNGMPIGGNLKEDLHRLVEQLLSKSADVGSVQLSGLLQQMIRNPKIYGDEQSENAIRKLLFSNSDVIPNLLLPASDIPVQQPNTKQSEVLTEMTKMLVMADRHGACEVAAQQAMWAHALLLASHSDKATYFRVIGDFARSSLPIGHPMRILYQLFAGQVGPAIEDLQQMVSQGCLASNQSTDLWQWIVAVILANRTPNDPSLLVAIGDALAQIGMISAAHFCYLLCVGDLDDTEDATTTLIGPASSETARITLLNTALPFLRPDRAYSDWKAVRLTELLEVIMNHNQSLFAHLLPYRLLLASWMADLGIIIPAFAHAHSLLFERAASIGQLNNPIFLYQLQSFHARLLSYGEGSDAFATLLKQAPAAGSRWPKVQFKSLWDSFTNKVIGVEEERVEPSSLQPSQTLGKAQQRFSVKAEQDVGNNSNATNLQNTQQPLIAPSQSDALVQPSSPVLSFNEGFMAKPVNVLHPVSPIIQSSRQDMAQSGPIGNPEVFVPPLQQDRRINPHYQQQPTLQPQSIQPNYQQFQQQQHPSVQLPQDQTSFLPQQQNIQNLNAQPTHNQNFYIPQYQPPVQQNTSTGTTTMSTFLEPTQNPQFYQSQKDFESHQPPPPIHVQQHNAAVSAQHLQQVSQQTSLQQLQPLQEIDQFRGQQSLDSRNNPQQFINEPSLASQRPMEFPSFNQAKEQMIPQFQQSINYQIQPIQERLMQQDGFVVPQQTRRSIETAPQIPSFAPQIPLQEAAQRHQLQPPEFNAVQESFFSKPISPGPTTPQQSSHLQSRSPTPLSTASFNAITVPAVLGMAHSPLLPPSPNLLEQTMPPLNLTGPTGFKSKIDDDFGISEFGTTPKIKLDETTARESPGNKEEKRSGMLGFLTGWLGGGSDKGQKKNGATPSAGRTASPAPSETGSSGAPKKANLGEPSSFRYDPELKRWVNDKLGDIAAPTPPPPPPPSLGTVPLPISSAGGADSSFAPPSSFDPNSYRRGAGITRSRYVDSLVDEKHGEPPKQTPITTAPSMPNLQMPSFGIDPNGFAIPPSGPFTHTSN